MLSEKWIVAGKEFLHVGVVLLVIIALISIVAGIVREYLPQEKIKDKLGKNKKGGPFIGALLGILTPFCSASMVPISMGMLEMNIGFSTVLSFLLAAPVANFVVVAIIFGVFGWKFALIYFLWTFTAAIMAGYLLGNRKFFVNNIKLTKVPKKCCAASAVKPVQTCCTGSASIDMATMNKSTPVCTATAPSTVATMNKSTCTATAPITIESEKESGFVERNMPRVKNGLLFSRVLFLQIFPYILIGAGISALTAAFVPTSLVEKYAGSGNLLSIPIAAAIGIPLYLRIEMAIPLLKILLVKGMSIGAAVALLIGGTGASLPEIAILLSMLKPKAVFAYTVIVFMIAVIGGFLFLLLM
jgi:uncharacterized membrane protein YraQ (UPF0718 family)